MNNIKYEDLLDYEKIKHVYHIIRVNTEHKEKLVKFEMFRNANIMNIESILQNRNYHHGKYNIFIISEPKYRIIMSERINDKIINHLVSHYVLSPLIEPKLIDMNVATRTDKGTRMALFYLKKYINRLKINNDKVYVLKCDISKFFYSINHEILIDKLSSIITDKEILDLIKEIINSTDYDYINKYIDKEVTREKIRISKLKITEKERRDKYRELDNIPRYEKGKGLPIGNMTSQILAIFYLNRLDHYIKEELHVKNYIRYMDDFILLSGNLDYLRKCLILIKEKIKEDDLVLNSKTQIYDLSKGFVFLGYRVVLKNKKLHILMNNKTKKRITKRINFNIKNGGNASDILDRYNGYLISVNSGYYIYKNKAKDR